MKSFYINTFVGNDGVCYPGWPWPTYENAVTELATKSYSKEWTGRTFRLDFPDNAFTKVIRKPALPPDLPRIVEVTNGE
jgi:hypothetical protein